jgi:hypothetical protein
MKDKSYQLTLIGMQAAEYLRVKRKRLTDDSYHDYESGLDKLARYFPDLRVEDFEPPTGTQRLEEFLDHQWGDSAPRPYNKGLSIIRDFFRRQIRRDKLLGDPTKPIGPHGLHSWWYRRLAAAGIVPEGTTKGEQMHKARHTAGQRVLDATGNLKAV